jgi:ribosomal protein S27E
MESCSGVYRPRNPQATPLYRLLEQRSDEVKGMWDEIFEERYGSWRGFVEGLVFRYLDCGIYERGAARVRCPSCREEYLLASSCKTRGLCPSCSAKRGAGFGALLAEEVIEDVGHTHWTFTMAKMLCPYLMRHRDLLGRQEGRRLPWRRRRHRTGRDLVGPGRLAT